MNFDELDKLAFEYMEKRNPIKKGRQVLLITMGKEWQTASLN